MILEYFALIYSDIHAILEDPNYKNNQSYDDLKKLGNYGQAQNFVDKMDTKIKTLLTLITNNMKNNKW